MSLSSSGISRGSCTNAIHARSRDISCSRLRAATDEGSCAGSCRSSRRPARTSRPDRRLLNVGISFDGLRALGIADDVLNEFPLDFSDGPSPGVLGDFGTSAPENWWHRKFPTTDVHLLVQLTAHSDDDMKAATDVVRDAAAATGVSELSATQTDNETIDGRLLGKGRLHFGYRDGISQPKVAWSDDEMDANHVNFRHFVLGYSTPDISSSPKVVRSRPVASTQATDLVHDGSYAVFKWIYQDVATFNRFLEIEGPRLAPDRPAAEARELLAAKMVGRWRDGTPLVLSPDSPSPDLASSNDFSYSTADPHGARCPFAAHIRVVNPRDQPLNPAEFGFVPRVIRRGTPFGPPLEGTDRRWPPARTRGCVPVREHLGADLQADRVDEADRLQPAFHELRRAGSAGQSRRCPAPPPRSRSPLARATPRSRWPGSRERSGPRSFWSQACPDCA